jgi:HK97 family phage prohead protease
MANKQFLPMQTRAGSFTPATINEEKRTVDVVWTTGAAVRRLGYIEELEVSLEAVNLSRLQNGAPVLDSHNSWDTGGIVGTVERAHIEGGKGVATLRFLKGDPAADRVWNMVQQGVLRAISVGYSVQKFIESRIDGVRRLRATLWTPMELSVVPVPADAGAAVRGYEYELEGNMPEEETRQNPENGANSESGETREAGKAETRNEKAETTANAETSDKARAAAPDSKRALEILDLCAIAKTDVTTARAFVESAKSVEEIRKELINMRAADSATISNAHNVAGSGEKSLAERAAETYKGGKQ